LARGEKVLIFLRHTGSPELPTRLLRLLREVTPSVAWLDAKKVPTGVREAWIDENVLKRKVKVLLVNPNAVKTGTSDSQLFEFYMRHCGDSTESLIEQKALVQNMLIACSGDIDVFNYNQEAEEVRIFATRALIDWYDDARLARENARSGIRRRRSFSGSAPSSRRASTPPSVTAMDDMHVGNGHGGIADH